MKWNGITIDDSMAMILDVIDGHGGEATTSLVKAYTPLDDNEQVKYRFRRLRDAGVLSIEDQGIGDDGRRLPLRVELTSEGQKFVENYDLYDESADPIRDQQSLDDRVSTLEDQMDRVRDDLWQLKSDVSELRDDVARLMAVTDVPETSPDEGESGCVFDGAPNPNVDSDVFNFGE